MKKDVIYIDIEDDITAIIDKVKSAKAPIVALVPPKRVGVLQSTVNLKLLQRAATSADKRVVLITNDQALTALAAGLSIPIAKNLQSKPEIAPLTALDADDDDIINGADLPVGEFADAAKGVESKGTASDEFKHPVEAVGAAAAASAAAKASKKGGVKIPNFDTFRKKLFLFGGLGVVVIGFLVWAIFFAGSATIAITARTNIINISKSLQLTPNATLDAKQGVVAPVVKQTKKSSTVDFEATGKKDVGDKATGTMKLTRTSVSSNPITVPTGTSFTNGAITFVSVEAATLAGTSVGPGGIVQDTATVRVQAAVIGEESNVSARSYSSNVGGFSSQGSVMAGGTKRQITVVSADDIAKAQEALKTQDSNTVKTELTKQFTADEIAMQEGFIVDAVAPVSVPAVDQEATTAKLSQETTYTLVGLKRGDLKTVYTEYLNAQIGNDSSQKVYEYGENATQFSQFSKTDTGYTAKATAAAQVGPNIDSAALAEELKGKRRGEVQQVVEAIQGVENVDIKLSPFWVTRVPNNTDQINVTFALKNDK